MNSNQENRGLWLVAFVVLAGVLYPQVRESRSGSPSGQGAKSAGEEQSDLKSFDVGVMPLSDDLWSKGKCGLKLLKYYGVGLPVVCTP